MRQWWLESKITVAMLRALVFGCEAAQHDPFCSKFWQLNVLGQIVRMFAPSRVPVQDGGSESLAFTRQTFEQSDSEFDLADSQRSSGSGDSRCSALPLQDCQAFAQECSGLNAPPSPAGFVR